jgi:hypothetical protein
MLPADSDGCHGALPSVLVLGLGCTPGSKRSRRISSSGRRRPDRFRLDQTGRSVVLGRQRTTVSCNPNCNPLEGPRDHLRAGCSRVGQEHRRKAASGSLATRVVLDWDAFMGPAGALAGREITQHPDTWPPRGSGVGALARKARSDR